MIAWLLLAAFFAGAFVALSLAIWADKERRENEVGDAYLRALARMVSGARGGEKSEPRRAAGLQGRY